MHWEIILNKQEIYNINAETKHEALALAVEGGLLPIKKSLEDFKIILIHRQDYFEQTGDELTTV